VSEPLNITFAILSKSRNDAVVDVLYPLLDSPHPKVAEAAVRSLLDRRSPRGMRELLHRLPTMDEQWKKIISEKRGRMTVVLRDAILGTDDEQYKNACQAILWFREYDLAPALVNSAEDTSNPQAELAADTLLNLAQLLYEELAGPRDYNERRDPKMVRKHIVTTLEASVSRFDKHNCRKIIESFLILAKHNNSQLRKILADPYNASFLTVVDVLTHNAQLGVMNLLLNSLDDPETPHAVLNSLAHRNDAEFIELLLGHVGADPSSEHVANLKRISQIAWAANGHGTLAKLDETAQLAAVKLVMLSGMKRIEVFGMIAYLLNNGNVGGRRAAAIALADFPGAEANALTQKLLTDPDPLVQASAVSQLRPRGIPGALTTLLEMIDSPFADVRQAVRDNLDEFSFKRFLAAFDMLEDDVRESTGALVRKIDPLTVPTLIDELESPGRTRRIRAMEVAEAIQVVPELESSVLEQLSDSDHMIRVKAAQILADCNTAATQRALREALLDSSVVVQEAAEASLQFLASLPPAPLHSSPAEETPQWQN
jgi:HEAT repeat protein